jgi:hypothetical protein
VPQRNSVGVSVCMSDNHISSSATVIPLESLGLDPIEHNCLRNRLQERTRCFTFIKAFVDLSQHSSLLRTPLLTLGLPPNSFPGIEIEASSFALALGHPVTVLPFRFGFHGLRQ